jgi:hypothetical protein
MPQATQTPPNNTEQELEAFRNSKYTFWDARLLADYWQQSNFEAKARIGRKILWGATDVAHLEQFLVNARVNHLQSVAPAPTPETYILYRDSGYGYDDAAALATFWGDASPGDAKLRIERNLTLNNEAIVKQALEFAQGGDCH